ncbi:MAG: hypothetical protein WAM73_01505 [Desulfobacterales bacterium]
MEVPLAGETACETGLCPAFSFSAEQPYLPVSTPVLKHDLTCLTDLWNPAGSIQRKQLISRKEHNHDYDTRIFAQLNHNGRQGDGKISRLPVWGPSPGKDPIFRETCKAIKIEDIRECIEYFAICAKNAVQGGFDSFSNISLDLCNNFDGVQSLLARVDLR